MSELRSRAVLDGYGIAMSTRSTVVQSITEAAAPAIEDVIASRVVQSIFQAVADLALYLRERGFVPTTTLVRTGLGVLLLLKVRHYPMAAYLVVPVYLLWETIGFAIVENLWTRFSPQLQAEAVKRYTLGVARLGQRWRQMPRAQASWKWLRRNQIKAGGSVLAGLLLSWIFRRIYRWRSSEAVRFRAQARVFFRAEAAHNLQKRQAEAVRRLGVLPIKWWLPRSWQLQREKIRIDRLVTRMVDEFGSSPALSRRLLLGAVDRDSSSEIGRWYANHSDGLLWIERGHGEPPPVSLVERDFLTIAPQLAFTKRVCKVPAMCTPFEVTFTLPSETLFGRERGKADDADVCGGFHMRVRYGFQHETGELSLADTIDWRMDAEPLEESAKGHWKTGNTSGGGGGNVAVSQWQKTGAAASKLKRTISQWRGKAGKHGDQSRPATARGVGGGDGSAVDEEGWFNPLVYDGGARLRPRLKNLQGEELPQMPPLRVQERKWERRFVTSGSSAASPSASDPGETAGATQQQYHELRHFTLTGFMPTCRPAGIMLPAGVRELCGQVAICIKSMNFVPKMMNFVPKMMDFVVNNDGFFNLKR